MPAAAFEKKLLVGKISGIFGTNGEVKIFSHTDPKSNLLSYQPLMVRTNDGWRPLEISLRKTARGIIGKMPGVETPEAARTLIGTEIYIFANQLPKLKNGEYYWHELVGLRVENTRRVALGTVQYLVDAGPNRVLVVRGLREHWLPYIENFVVQVEIEKQKIIVDWDENF